MAGSVPWQLMNSFPSCQDAEAAIAGMDVRKQRTDKRKDFKKVTYTCRCAVSQGCPVQLRLDLPWAGGACNVYFAYNHNHSAPSGHGLSGAVKRKIAQGIELKLQPHQIRRTIEMDNHPPLQNKQLENAIHRAKVAKYGEGSLTTGGLERWAKERQFTNQLGPDDPFVSMYKADPDKPFFFLTTPRLTRNSVKSLMIQTDATYKLNWEAFPVIITGTSDRNGSFHLSGLALIWSDEDAEAYRTMFEAVAAARTFCNVSRPIKHVMADGVSSMSNAIAASPYAGAKRLMCNAHMKRNVKDKKSRLGPDFQEQWLEVDANLNTLQSSPSPDIYSVGLGLFLSNIRNNGGTDFANYFSHTYVNSTLSEWYEGAAPLLVSHNNSLENFNRKVKQQYTYHTTCRLPEFLGVADYLVRTESSHLKPFCVIPTASLEVQTAAYQWIHDSPEIHVGSGTNGKPLYMVKGSKCTLTGEQFLRYRAQPSLITDWKTFEAFRYSWYYVYRHNDGFSVCDCPVGLKRKICKHSLGIDILHHGYNVTQAARDVPIGQRRGKGRPKAPGNRYQFV